MLQIRPAAVHDLPGAYRVCLLTGDSGEDARASHGDPDLLGHVFVGPYIVGQPGLARVLVDEGGVAGYRLAAEDTRAFEAWTDAHWWPALRERYPRRDDGTPDGSLIAAIHDPPRVPDVIVRAHPAHLHIDLLERARGQGLGRVLIEGLLDDLRQRGVGGVHLEVGEQNAGGIGFYEHLGFRRLDVRPGSVLMGIRLD